MITTIMAAFAFGYCVTDLGLTIVSKLNKK
jgi:hypothetical protein